MGLFDEVKENVTVRQAAEFYGFKITKSGLISCIFHNDKTPSMKVDRRYYCFGCGVTGTAYQCERCTVAARSELYG